VALGPPLASLIFRCVLQAGIFRRVQETALRFPRGSTDGTVADFVPAQKLGDGFQVLRAIIRLQWLGSAEDSR
jgi:hypothetical protein